ncbi:MAG: TPM domain-containing protein [Verrucomicrobia bacterium]|jgi:uncharacterized membrane protein|nr:TPM domain-containing protein [Verrucomicrobiota bacterium]
MARFLTKSDEQRVLEAIREAETNTSGEIRVHLQPRCKGDPMEAAKKRFERLKMTQTEKRNGVLFFVSTRDQKLAVLGDKGIDDATPPDFWESIVTAVTDCFREGRIPDGLCEGIRMAGKALQAYFPYQSDDVNELTDEISYA